MVLFSKLRVYQSLKIKEAPQGPQKLRSLKSIKYSRPPSITGISPFQILGGKIVKNVQMDPQTTDISSKKLKVRE